MAEHTIPIDDPALLATMADWQRRRYTEQLAQMAASLRRLADDIESEGTPRSDQDGIGGTPAYAMAAERAQHALAWGLANTGLHRLTGAAAELDRTLFQLRRTGEAATDA